MTAPRTWRSVPCQAWPLGVYSASGRPAAIQAHTSCTGHCSQVGDFAVQTSAPSSMVAAFHTQEVGVSAGMSASARRVSAAVSEREGRALPLTARACTRRIFVSMTVSRRPNAKTLMAAAV